MDPKRIITERESHGLKQYQLAKIAGISPSQMSRVEAGKRRLRADEAERIANRLNLNIAEFPRARNCAQLPLPEGMASVEYPSELSPQSRDELKQWLELIAKLASR
jgi:transcriptional regulator with XRE-family HTH domain